MYLYVCLYECAFEAERRCFLITAFCHSYFYDTLHPLFHQSLGNLLILTKLSRDLFVIQKVYIDLQQEIFWPVIVEVSVWLDSLRNQMV